MATAQTPDAGERLQMLQKYQHIAVVGLSADVHKHSYGVSNYMQIVGYDIIPINPRYAGQEILGKHVYATLTEAKDAGEPIEIVNVFRRSHNVPPVVEEALTVGAKAVWVQLGIISDEAKKKALEANLPYVQNKCIKIEHEYLLGD